MEKISCLFGRVKVAVLNKHVPLFSFIGSDTGPSLACRIY